MSIEIHADQGNRIEVTVDNIKAGESVWATFLDLSERHKALPWARDNAQRWMPVAQTVMLTLSQPSGVFIIPRTDTWTVDIGAPAHNARVRNLDNNEAAS